jgi:hypothetical protein
MSMSGSTTKMFFTLPSDAIAAAMALRASPGTRWRMAMRTLNMPPLAGVAKTRTGSRTAVSSARQIMTSLRMALSCAVSVRLMALPPMLIDWNSASLRLVIAVRWNTGLRLTAP